MVPGTLTWTASRTPHHHHQKPQVQTGHTHHVWGEEACTRTPIHTHRTDQLVTRDARVGSGDCLWGLHVGRIIRRLAGRVGQGCTS